jgi:hypothetical protein
MRAILATCLHVGRDGTRIVIRLHDDQAGAEDHKEVEHVLLPRAPNDDARWALLRDLPLRFRYPHRPVPLVSADDFMPHAAERVFRIAGRKPDTAHVPARTNSKELVLHGKSSVDPGRRNPTPAHERGRGKAHRILGSGGVSLGF